MVLLLSVGAGRILWPMRLVSYHPATLTLHETFPLSPSRLSIIPQLITSLLRLVLFETERIESAHNRYANEIK